MATSTFERKIEITEPESIKRLIAVMAKEVAKKPLSDHPYTEAERERSEQVIKAVLIPLKTLIDELEEDRELKPLLSSFSCEQPDENQPMVQMIRRIS